MVSCGEFSVINYFSGSPSPKQKIINGVINILNSVRLDCVFRCFISETLLHMM
tara:strand:- start:1905 stop:2063 length:159 start_codon:yes stop_codon:yes gene_type:complete